MPWTILAVAHSLTGQMTAKIIAVDDASPNPLVYRRGVEMGRLNSPHSLDVRVATMSKRAGIAGARNFGQSLESAPVTTTFFPMGAPESSREH